MDKSLTSNTPSYCHCGDHVWKPISKGYAVIASPEDIALLKQRHHAHVCKTHNGRCVHVYARGNDKVLLHRSIAGVVSEELVDHANGNGLDNRRINLRACDGSLNRANSSARKRSSTGIKGISPSDGGYRATLTVRGELVFNKRFRTIDDAAEAYDMTAKLYLGDFAFTNRDSVKA